MFEKALTVGVSTASLAWAGGAAAELFQDPYTQQNGSWIELEGRVVDVVDESFVLDYERGTVRVEMDDWDWYNERRHILVGDRITAIGKIDELFLNQEVMAEAILSLDGDAAGS